MASRLCNTNDGDAFRGEGAVSHTATETHGPGDAATAANNLRGDAFRPPAVAAPLKDGIDGNDISEIPKPAADLPSRFRPTASDWPKVHVNGLGVVNQAGTFENDRVLVWRGFAAGSGLISGVDESKWLPVPTKYLGGPNRDGRYARYYDLETGRVYDKYANGNVWLNNRYVVVRSNEVGKNSDTDGRADHAVVADRNLQNARIIDYDDIVTLENHPGSFKVVSELADGRFAVQAAIGESPSPAKVLDPVLKNTREIGIGNKKYAFDGQRVLSFDRSGQWWEHPEYLIVPRTQITSLQNGRSLRSNLVPVEEGYPDSGRTNAIAASSEPTDSGNKARVVRPGVPEKVDPQLERLKDWDYRLDEEELEPNTPLRRLINGAVASEDPDMVRLVNNYLNLPSAARMPPGVSTRDLLGIVEAMDKKQLEDAKSTLELINLLGQDVASRLPARRLSAAEHMLDAGVFVAFNPKYPQPISHFRPGFGGAHRVFEGENPLDSAAPQPSVGLGGDTITHADLNLSNSLPPELTHVVLASRIESDLPEVELESELSGKLRNAAASCPNKDLKAMINEYLALPPKEPLPAHRQKMFDINFKRAIDFMDNGHWDEAQTNFAHLLNTSKQLPDKKMPLENAAPPNGAGLHIANSDPSEAPSAMKKDNSGDSAVTNPLKTEALMHTSTGDYLPKDRLTAEELDHLGVIIKDLADQKDGDRIHLQSLKFAHASLSKADEANADLVSQMRNILKPPDRLNNSELEILKQRIDSLAKLESLTDAQRAQKLALSFALRALREANPDNVGFVAEMRESIFHMRTVVPTLAIFAITAVASDWFRHSKRYGTHEISDSL